MPLSFIVRDLAGGYYIPRLYQLVIGMSSPFLDFDKNLYRGEDI
jgi:hypothetical protein